MTLSRLDVALSLSDLYPDQVRITYRYIIPVCSSQTFASVLRPYGFRTVTGMPGMRASLNWLENADPTPVMARKSATVVAFTVSINILTWLHRHESRSFGDERSTSGENYLHPLAFEDSGPVWLMLYERIVEHEGHAGHLADEIAQAAGAGEPARLQAINVSHIELCADFATDNPHATFRALLPAFKERYRRVVFIGYGNLPTARAYGELHHDMNLMRGFLTEGVSFKLYEKTNRRIRLEVEYKRNGLDRLGAPISLIENDEILPLFNFLGAHCLPEMSAISQTGRNDCDIHWSAYDLIARVAPLFRSRSGDLATFLRCFSLDGRVTTRTLPSRRLSRLARAEIVQRVNHSIYAITPEYYGAFRALRLIDAVWRRALTHRTNAEPLAGAAE